MSQPLRIVALENHHWTKLRRSSLSEGYHMVERLIDEFHRGVNRFDAPGEALYAHFSGDMVIAACGLNREQNPQFPCAGRIRRLYVLPEFRERGLARSLVSTLTEQSQAYFDTWTVNVGNTAACGFYERLGFSPISDSRITHVKKRV